MLGIAAANHHHIALTLMALHFILQIQIENKEEVPLLSVPDIKLIFAKKLLNKLNLDHGLLHALEVRHRQREADIDRFSAKVELDTPNNTFLAFTLSRIGEIETYKNDKLKLNEIIEREF